ncbi:MAG: precorrin-3B C(17)-methyltransferase, partial [Proteobacteria bacterium]|nr:precorrin-3B C(17)-methyltransferase [Pseudomonadota bacterium]
MAVKPVVICLSRSGQTTADKIAKITGYAVHGRKGRVDQADAFFDNALDHIRDLFAAKTPVIGICASG